jgi:ribosomal subunit interface protein
MQIPLKIDFQNLDPSEFIERRVRARTDRLERHFQRVTGCHVTIEAPHCHHLKGNEYRVRIVLHVPGEEIVISRDPGEVHAHTDVYVAIRDAFDAAERRLESHAQKVRGDVKTHQAPVQGYPETS